MANIQNHLVIQIVAQVLMTCHGPIAMVLILPTQHLPVLFTTDEEKMNNFLIFIGMEHTTIIEITDGMLRLLTPPVTIGLTRHIHHPFLDRSQSISNQSDQILSIIEMVLKMMDVVVEVLLQKITSLPDNHLGQPFVMNDLHL